MSYTHDRTECAEVDAGVVELERELTEARALLRRWRQSYDECRADIDKELALETVDFLARQAPEPAPRCATCGYYPASDAVCTKCGTPPEPPAHDEDVCLGRPGHVWRGSFGTTKPGDPCECGKAFWRTEEREYVHALRALEPSRAPTPPACPACEGRTLSTEFGTDMPSDHLPTCPAAGRGGGA